MIYGGAVDVGSTQTKAIILGDARQIVGRALIDTGANVTRAAEKAFDLALKELEKQYAMGAQIGDTAAMSGDAFSMGEILLEAGKTAEALRRYDQSRDLLLASSLSQDIKDNATLNHHFNLGRVALRRNNLATAKSEAEAFMTGATAKHNDFQIRQAHELQGMIALQEKDYDKALAELGQANQQNGYNLYRMGLAYAGKKDTGKQQEMFSKAANLNNLPTLNEAFVRTKAQKQANTA